MEIVHSMNFKLDTCTKVVCLYALKFENFLSLCAEISRVQKSVTTFKGKNEVPVSAENRKIGEILKISSFRITIN